MRRRLVCTTVAVTASALLVFGIAFGWALGRIYRTQQLDRLHQAATLAVAAVPAGGLHGNDPVEPPLSTPGVNVAYYDLAGLAVAGPGPARADALVRQALGGRTVEGTVGNQLVVAEPIVSNETPIGAVEAFSSASTVRASTLHAWLAIAICGAVILMVAALVAEGLARRLIRPVDDLVRLADHLATGNLRLSAKPSGLPEMDRAADALRHTGTHLQDLIERERAFTAHASHQLRTPLTSLRLTLDTMAETPNIDVRAAAKEAAAEAERFQHTLDELLSISKATEPNLPLMAIHDIFDGVKNRWHGPLAQLGRRLTVTADTSITERTIPRAITQTLDILIDNATTHGRGTVSVMAAPAGDGMVIEVHDEGDGTIPTPPSGSSRHRRTNAHGLGLPLAASLIEAAGGRLVVKHPGPRPVVSVLLPSYSR